MDVPVALQAATQAALADEDLDVRVNCLDALERARGDGEVEATLEKLRGDPDLGRYLSNFGSSGPATSLG